jgi:hypothetical protein
MATNTFLRKRELFHPSSPTSHTAEKYEEGELGRGYGI